MTRENDAVEHLTESDPSILPTAVITGSSSGIGLAAAEELARRGWRVALVGRDPARLAAATDRVRAASSTGDAVASYRCDFEVLADVATLAATLRDAYPHLDLLANNAGGFLSGSTVDGFPAMMQTNHLAHFLLSGELREQLRGGRIVNTSSAAHNSGRLSADDPWRQGSPRPMGDYGSAKQANILFTVEAAKRWPDIVSTAFHPGVVRTRFGAGIPVVGQFFKFMPGLRTPAKGAQTLVWLATTDRTELLSGGYYHDCRLAGANPRATDPDTAAALWTASLAALPTPPPTPR